MCGIAGWVAYQHDLEREAYVVDAMTDSMAARGPDGRGTWISRHAALGICRLAVIDLAGGRQPIVAETPQGPVAIVYSGETYNFAEIRKALIAAGHQFTTSSDTEVVLRGYLEWGEAVAERLNGIYAFSIWDSRDQKLVMIRDRMGVKPLYYFPTADGVLFGSEPKAILANPLAQPRVSLAGLRGLFASFAFIRNSDGAVWEGMLEVDPGTVVTVGLNGIRRHVYWSLTSVEHPDDQETSVAWLRELLDDIVTRQLVTDAPRSALLSGGLDSSSITALATRHAAADGEIIRSFTVDVVGQTEEFVPNELCSTPDIPYAHEAARHFGTQHEDIVLDPTEIADPAARAKVIRARDLPLGLGDRDTSLYLLFKAIRQRSTVVVLSGECADEVFGGYQEFFSAIARSATTFPWLARDGRDLGEGGSSFTPGLIKALNLRDFIADSYNSAIAEVHRTDGESEFEYRMRKINYLYITRYMPLLLDRKDRASMAVGLEVRVPFADHRLVEYVYNAPWALKTWDGREKALLRGATGHLLPRSVRERVKCPYPFMQDAKYALTIQENSRELLAQISHPVFEFVSRPWLKEAAHAEPSKITHDQRRGLERALDLAQWLDLYTPAISFE